MLNTAIPPPTQTQICRWRPFADEAALLDRACQTVLDAANEAIRLRGAFHVVLAGGSTPRKLYRKLCTSVADWSTWHIYWGDERALPANDPERNSLMALEDWLVKVAIPPQQIHPIPAELGALAAVAAYQTRLQNLGAFDLVLLGIGEDGHTASLFPNQEWGVLPSSRDVLAVFDAPKPPPERISMSAHRLSLSAQVVVLVSGESKRDAISRWRMGENLPIGAICPANGVDIFVEAALLTP